MKLKNTIFYKSLSALYDLNSYTPNRTKSLIIDAIYQGLLIGKDGLEQAKLEMALDTARGTWLDLWGDTFGVYRVDKETDDKYRIRIIQEIISPKNTIPSLKEATSRFLETYKHQHIHPTDIKVYEPWTGLLILDERGTLDGKGRIVSNDYWRHAVIDIALPDTSLITPDLIEYLNTIKAGGVKIVFSISPIWGIIKDPNKEEKQHKVLQKIKRNPEITPKINNSIFKTLYEYHNEEMNTGNGGGILDESLYLDGKQKVFWEGINFTRTMYATGVLRNHLSSAVLSLTNYEHIDKPNMTIQEGINLEEKSFNGTRINEGRLTLTQGNIQVKKRYVTNKGYIPYTKARFNPNNYLFPYDNILDFMSFEELEDLNPSIQDFFYAFENPSRSDNKELNTKINEIKQGKIKETYSIHSMQYPIEITTVAI